MEVVLTIAGSDSSAGAGIQQDLKTIAAHGCYGATVITSITSQNTQGVQGSMPVPPDVVVSQLRAVLSDLEPAVIKIGMLPDRAVAEAVVDTLETYQRSQHLVEMTDHAEGTGSVGVPIIYDPVMVSTSGYPLMQSETIDYIAQRLFPLCTLITPNLPETDRLLEQIGIPPTPRDILRAGKGLSQFYGTAFLLKGGHADSSQMTDFLFETNGTVSPFTTERIVTGNLHGTGCTLSSAIAAHLAQGASLAEAVRKGKEYVTTAIRRSVDSRIGHGNGPLI